MNNKAIGIISQARTQTVFDESDYKGPYGHYPIGWLILWHADCYLRGQDMDVMHRADGKPTEVFFSLLKEAERS